MIIKRHTNLRLWLLLASVPFGIVVLVYIYGNSNLDSSIIKESDLSTDSTNMTEVIQIEERTTDIAEHVNQKMMLPETKPANVKTTSKTDKRMLDESGNMLTVDVKDEQTTLQSLAAEHLGNENFWVFFFDVNRDKLNEPTDIKVGMKLYIPNPEFFGFSAQDQASIQYAKRRAEEILNKKQ